MKITRHTGATLAIAACAAGAIAQPVEEVGEPFHKETLPIRPFKQLASANAPALTPLGGAIAQRWTVMPSDVTLARTLERWSEAAGYRIKWDAERNFLISAPSSFTGDFETVLSAVLSTPGIRSSDYPLEACIYANTPPLVRITRQGEQARECVALAQ
jgi:hypothetical protein